MEKNQRYALISCYDKTDLVSFAFELRAEGYKIISTGGTYEEISNAFSSCGYHGVSVIKVSDITGFPEILNGRVKTLHPIIHGALLTDWDNPAHAVEAEKHGIPRIDVVVVNLYPFWEVNEETTLEEAVELIDIGGVAMLRAAAKNYKHISVYTSPDQYFQDYDDRKAMAQNAFELTTRYDHMISNYFLGKVESGGLDQREGFIERKYEMVEALKYGCNPHQSPGAGIFSIDGSPVPLKLLNGEWGYINVLDALGCWGLVTELVKVTGRVAACSFKHTSPAGAAVYVPRDELDLNLITLLDKVYGNPEEGDDKEPALSAYMRARNADPMSSFGDFIGISGIVTERLAQFISKQISDGIVASAYSVNALKILKKKKQGKYVIIQGDPKFVLQQRTVEIREMMGMAIVQPTNQRIITREDMSADNIVTFPDKYASKLPSCALLDLLVANTCLKYAQSNNVACAYQGQLVGLSAGQQSRVHSVRLACSKAEVWKRRHHPAAIAMLEQFRDDVKPQARINATTALAEDPERFLEEYGDLLRSGAVETIHYLFQAMHLQKNPFSPSLSLASDAFFPFPDSIHCAHKNGIVYISQPGGSNRDAEVMKACSDHGMWMLHTGVRIFTH